MNISSPDASKGAKRIDKFMSRAMSDRIVGVCLLFEGTIELSVLVGAYLVQGFGRSQDTTIRRTKRCFRVIEAALEHIDMRIHEGEHPRIGAVDACPFVPLEENN